MIEALKKLEELKELKDNWDSYGAPPIDKECIKRARWFLLAIGPKVSRGVWSVPCSHGGVQLEWHQGAVNLEIEFKPGGGLEMLYDDIGMYQTEKEWE